MAGRLSKSYRVHVFRPGIKDKRRKARTDHKRTELASHSVTLTRKRQAIATARAAAESWAVARGLGVGTQAEVYGGEKLDALVYQCTVTRPVSRRTGLASWRIRVDPL
jgi:hypothetical protein